MESECSRCHRKFQSSTEEMTVCPDCLRAEFTQAAPVSDASELADIKRENAVLLRRQKARAASLSDGFQTGAAFSAYGMLRFALGIAIFLICVFIFMIDSGPGDGQSFSFLPVGAQRPVSIIFCWVAAGLVLTSSRQRKWLIYPLVLFFVVAGWYMPTFWHFLEEKQRKETAAVIAASEIREVEVDPFVKAAQAAPRYSRELTEADLAIFREKKRAEGSVVNYGIYVNTRDARTRQSIRDAIARLLEAESCVPYTRGQGSLFIVSRAAGGVRNISRVVARFGDLNYSNPGDGIYEVAFMPEKVNAVSRFSSEVLTSPGNASFVTANIAELRNLLDPQRVLMAANALRAANVQVLRKDIRDALIEVLRDPWAPEPDTYEGLVEALVTYAPPGDAETVDVCRKYFIHSRANNSKPSSVVMDLLIRETPDEMVTPVVELWTSNPVEWESLLSQLGTRSQDHLLDLLADTESLQLIGTILKHLEHHGTPEAAPVVQKFVEHPDSLISRTARSTLQALKG